MYCVYILQSELNVKKLYIGFTARKMILRLKDHNYGGVGATEKHRPWKLIYCEVYSNEKDARNRERMLKQYGSSWGHLKKRLINTLKM